MPEELFNRDPAFPRLSGELLRVLPHAGQRRSLEHGSALYRAGDSYSEFFVVVRGRVALIDQWGSLSERVIGVLDEHCFAGELNLMTGQLE